MGLSTIAVEQREKEEQQLRSFLTYSLIGSLVTHISLLILSTLWVKPAEVAAEEPIEIEIVDAPSIEETKPPENTELQAEATAGGGSGGSGGGFAGGSGGGAGASEIETNSASAQVAPKNAIADARLSSITSTPLPSIAPQPEVPQFKIPDVPQPLSTRQIASSLLPEPPVVPKPDPIPTPVASVPPEATPAPEPTPLASLPPDAIPEPVKPTPTPSPKQEPKPLATPSPSPTPTPQASPVVNASPPVQPSQPVIPRFPDLGALAQTIPNLFNPQNNTPTAQPIAANPLIPSSNTGGASNSSKFATGTGNTSGTNRGTGSGTGSGTGTGNGNGSGFGSGPGTGSGFGSGPGTGNGDGSGTGTKLATGARNINRNPPAPRSGNTSPKCDPCTKPRHPSGAEELEGTVVVKMDVDKNGNVSNIAIASGSGHNILDQAALETVRNQWKFTKSDNGQAGIKKKITFTLEGSNYNRIALERQRLADKKQRERQQQQERQRQALERQQQQERERQQQEANQLLAPVPVGIPDNTSLPPVSVPSIPATPPPVSAPPIPTPPPQIPATPPPIIVPPVPAPTEPEETSPPEPSASP